MEALVKLVLENLTMAGVTFTAIVEFLLRIIPTKRKMSVLRLAARILDFIIKDRVK